MSSIVVEELRLEVVVDSCDSFSLAARSLESEGQTHAYVASPIGATSKFRPMVRTRARRVASQDTLVDQ